MHVKRNIHIQLGTTKVEEAMRTRALGPKILMKELVLDVQSRPCDVRSR